MREVPTPFSASHALIQVTCGLNIASMCNFASSLYMDSRLLKGYCPVMGTGCAILALKFIVR